MPDEVGTVGSSQPTLVCDRRKSTTHGPWTVTTSSKQMHRRSRYVATSMLCLEQAPMHPRVACYAWEIAPMHRVQRASVGSVITGQRWTSEMDLRTGSWRPPGTPPSGSPPGPGRAGPGRPGPPGAARAPPLGASPGAPFWGLQELLVLLFPISRPPKGGVPGNPPGNPPRAPPLGGCPGRPGPAPGCTKSAHFFGYLITLPVGTVWALFFPPPGTATPLGGALVCRWG